MPQLNPSPWLLMALTTWLTISIILSLINNNYLITNPKTTETDTKTKQINHWTWPW
uniref:ATP synthase complex subunit 8 n=1 Tax=Calumma parsonii TaxID=179907 RepID=D6RRY7_CALPR|nr:ATPase subunit 8 [Calumma parsonii]